MRRLILAVAAVVPLGACGGGVSSRGHHPCSLMTGAETAAYVGPLASPPYRASDGAADARGDECMYHGKDGREVALRPEWEGGALTGKVLQGVPDALGGVLGKAAPGLDSMTHMVMKPESGGPWDKATWIPSGALFASKGPAQVQVDVSGASGKESDALAIAKIAVPRLAHPLDYDGAEAVALAPRATAHPARACDMVPRAAIEAAIGPLDGAPTSDAPETECTWRVHSPEGERTYAVGFVWQGGGKNYRMLTHGMSMVGGMLGMPGGASALDSMKLPPNVQSMVGGFMKSLAGSSEGGGSGSATGAVGTVGFKTDTALKGPWDNAALLHGTQLVAVRHDVFVGMTLTSADYEKAKALLGAICSRL
ncbi:MAG: hypothetical protein ACREOQ_00810 [Gemmatimonadales bacterium]